MSRLSRLAASLRPSPTMAGTAARVAHPDPVDLSVGEPAAAPPWQAREAAARAALDDRARYGPAAGLPALREAVARDLTHRDGLSRDGAQVIVTPGGKAALLDALRCLVDPGDEVVVFAPHWPSFLDQVALVGGVAVVVPPGPDLLPEPEALEAAVGSRTKVVILNQPSNPAGTIWDPQRLAQLSRLVRAHGAWVLVDQVYGTLSLSGPERPFLAQVPELVDQTVLVESFSKRFSLTGYRLGAAAGPVALIQAMTALGSASHTHACMLSQAAGLAALEQDGSWETEERESLRQRRDRGTALLEGIPGLHCPVPEGGLYLFPEVRGWLAAQGGGTDADLVVRLREAAGLKVLPGTAFGTPGFLRISLGAPEARLMEGLSRLRDFLETGHGC